MATILHTLKKYGWLIALWFLFSAGCLVAPFLALSLPFAKHRPYLRRLLHAADRLCAALLGFSGRHLLSTELGASTRMPWLREALNSIETKHCEESVYAEGAYCRLSDHELGIY